MNLQQEIRELVAAILQIPADELDTSACFFDDEVMYLHRAVDIVGEVVNKKKNPIDQEMVL